jgi:hypothetical protein
MLGFFFGFLVAILIVVVQIYLKIGGYNLDQAIDKLPKVKQKAEIIRIKPRRDQKVEEIIKETDKAGKDLPLEKIL